MILNTPSARIDRGGGDLSPEAPQNRLHLSSSHSPEQVFVPTDLIEYLNRVFPDRLSLVEALGSVDAARGARAVVSHLAALNEEQTKTNVLRLLSPSSAAGGGTSPTPSAPDSPAPLPSVPRGHDGSGQRRQRRRRRSQGPQDPSS